MLKPIGVGTEVFHKLIEENKYYVDKTALLRTVFKENGSEVLLITRPRRFGKTLTMSTFHDCASAHCFQRERLRSTADNQTAQIRQNPDHVDFL